MDDLTKLIKQTAAPTMMLSLKLFKGTQKSLTMSGEGCLVAVDCYQNAKTAQFMSELDQLVIVHKGQPNLTKDSRLPGNIAEATLPHYQGFKHGLFAYDKDRIMRSELSARLGLT